MGKLVTIVGASGVGKTALVKALSKAYPFATAYEQHAERPFQALFKQDKKFALANQLDYFLLRAEQERDLRASPRIGLEWTADSISTSTASPDSFSAGTCSPNPNLISADASTPSSANRCLDRNSSSACARMR